MVKKLDYEKKLGNRILKLLNRFKNSINNLTAGEFGKYAEKLAVKYLKNQGFKILNKNFKTKFGEIDIIALVEGKTIAFIEVKAIRGDFIDPIFKVNKIKQQKIRQVAEYYLIKNNFTNHEVRFDIIIIKIFDKQKNINYLINQF